MSQKNGANILLFWNNKQNLEKTIVYFVTSTIFSPNAN